MKVVKKQRWTVSGREVFMRWYMAKCKGGGATRDLSQIKWYPSREAAERSFDHSQWVAVSEEEVLAELVAEALTEQDETLWPS